MKILFQFGIFFLLCAIVSSVALANPQKRANCKVTIPYGQMTLSSRCFSGEVMTGIQSLNPLTIYCSRVSVDCLHQEGAQEEVERELLDAPETDAGTFPQPPWSRSVNELRTSTSQPSAQALAHSAARSALIKLRDTCTNNSGIFSYTGPFTTCNQVGSLHNCNARASAFCR